MVVDGVAIRVVHADVLHELVHDIVGEDVDAVVVVAVLGEVALDLEVDDDALLVANGMNLRVLDGGQGIGDNGEACDTGSEPAVNVLVVQGHLDALVAVLVMHVVDDVQRVHVHAGQPLHHVLVLLHDVVEVQGIALDGTELGPTCFLETSSTPPLSA